MKVVPLESHPSSMLSLANSMATASMIMELQTILVEESAVILLVTSTP